MKENKRFQGDGSRIFDYDYKKELSQKKLGLTREQKLLEILKKSAKVKEYNFTLQ